MARDPCLAFLKCTFTVLSLLPVAFVPGFADQDASQVFHYGSDGDADYPIYPFTGQSEAFLRLRRQASEELMTSDTSTNVTTMLPAASTRNNASGTHSSGPTASAMTNTPPSSTRAVTATPMTTTVAMSTSTSMPSTKGTPHTGSTEPTVIEADRKYYVVTMRQKDSSRYWDDLRVNGAIHKTLSQGHRLAQTIKLKFVFNFYGHFVTNVTIATGGFLYMSPFLHKFLTATQYIAPLMANFDTSIRNESQIRYLSTSEKLVVQWENVHLKDQVEYGPFNFQVHLIRGGQIFFVYKDVPVNITRIMKDNHPVKIGLSDAFYIDKDDQRLGLKRRTIYEYHRVTVNLTQIYTDTVVVMEPKKTCNQETTCEGCLGLDSQFDCSWCGIVQRCSDGIDWYRQHWLDQGCKYMSGKDNCSLIPTVLPHSKRPLSKNPDGKGINPGAVVAIIVIVALVIGISGWIFYAYRNPTTSSGIWLMEHRPSAMKTKLAKMKFWKQSTPSGDKYAVESQA